MKKNLLACAVLGAASCAISGSAAAQTNVTVYGIIDTAVRYTDDNPLVGGGVGNQTVLGSGGIWGSRIGFKGEEDLGGGTSAVFKLENGFAPTTGTIGQQGQLFGRQAYLGLKDAEWGEIDAGRQYGVAATWDFAYDPLGVGNFNENSWQYYLYGYRFDNTLKYGKSWVPLALSVQYSVGGQAGETDIGATEGVSLAYAQGPFSVGGFYQESKDQNGNAADVAGLGGFYLAGPAKLYLNYFQATRDPGFAKGASGSGLALANTSFLGNAGNDLQRKDGVWTAGAVFNPTHEKGWTFTLAAMHDSVTNDSSLGDSGSVTTAYGLAEYNFSKRTEVYFDLDHTSLCGGEIGDKNTVMAAAGSSFGGNTGRTGAAVGMIVKF